MTIEVEITCPLGSKCEEIKDGKIIRCAWYTKVTGKDPQSEKDIDTWGCAMAWMPLLMVEMSQTNRGQTSVLESFRNETVKQRQEEIKAEALKTVTNIINAKKPTVFIED